MKSWMIITRRVKKSDDGVGFRVLQDKKAIIMMKF